MASLLNNNPYKDIPRLTESWLEDVSNMAGITSIKDFDPHGDSAGESMKWPRISKSVLIRDNYSCRVCGKSELSNFSTADQYNRLHLAVQVHHIVPKKDGGKDNFRNLVTLCEECHRKTFSNDYAGLPVSSQTTIYGFERRIRVCVREEWIDDGRARARRAKLKDYTRSFDTSSGTYKVVPMKGESLDILFATLGSEQYRSICESAHAENHASDYTTLLVETESGREIVRFFLGSEDEILL